jgi:hypothetical protein
MWPRRSNTGWRSEQHYVKPIKDRVGERRIPAHFETPEFLLDNRVEPGCE